MRSRTAGTGAIWGQPTARHGSEGDTACQPSTGGGHPRMSESPTTGATSQLTDGTAAGRWTLDPAGSRAEFSVKHFWGAITVRGTLERMTGEATVSPDGTVTGQISFDADSLNTKNKQRDKHLRSADFFHVEKPPQAVLTITSARPAGPAELECEGTFEAAGHVRPVNFTA